jgi:hypothetical protein
VDSELFAFDPAAQRVEPLALGLTSGLGTLAACSDGTVYVGSGSLNSMYSGPAYLFAFRPDCTSGLVGTWDRVTWEADTPPGTRVSVDVLSADGRTLLPDVRSGTVLTGINSIQYPALTLQATLSSDNPATTPALKHWRVDYTFHCRRP